MRRAWRWGGFMPSNPAPVPDDAFKDHQQAMYRLAADIFGNVGELYPFVAPGAGWTRRPEAQASVFRRGGSTNPIGHPGPCLRGDRLKPGSGDTRIGRRCPATLDAGFHRHDGRRGAEGGISSRAPAALALFTIGHNWAGILK